MNVNKNGTFKIGADLNAENVPTPNKEYVPGTFRGTLTSVEGNQYSIHNMKRQLFGGIEGGSVKNINLANVNINMPWINDISALAKTVKMRQLRISRLLVAFLETIVLLVLLIRLIVVAC